MSQQQLSVIKNSLLANQNVIKDTLPDGVSFQRFGSIVMQAVTSDPKIMACDPQSIVNAAKKCAADGLIPDGRQAAMVIFKGTLQYMPMYQGIIDVIYRAGTVKSIKSNIVYQNDEVTLIQGDDEKFEHKPLLFGDRGAPIGVYCVAKLSNGEVMREFMSREEIDVIKNAAPSQNGPWNGPHFLEMWKKTVFRRLSKWLPLSKREMDIINAVDGDVIEGNVIDGNSAPKMQGRISEAPPGFGAGDASSNGFAGQNNRSDEPPRINSHANESFDRGQSGGRGELDRRSEPDQGSATYSREESPKVHHMEQAGFDEPSEPEAPEEPAEPELPEEPSTLDVQGEQEQQTHEDEGESIGESNDPPAAQESDPDPSGEPAEPQETGEPEVSSKANEAKDAYPAADMKLMAELEGLSDDDQVNKMIERIEGYSTASGVGYYLDLISPILQMLDVANREVVMWAADNRAATLKDGGN